MAEIIEEKIVEDRTLLLNSGEPCCYLGSRQAVALLGVGKMYAEIVRLK